MTLKIAGGGRISHLSQFPAFGISSPYPYWKKLWERRFLRCIHYFSINSSIRARVRLMLDVSPQDSGRSRHPKSRDLPYFGRQ
jgi:hypothetical protein